MNLQILIWIFFGIFSVTAIITLLGITGVIKTIKDKYLNALFTALILEVVAAVIGVFKGIDVQDMQNIPVRIFEETHLNATNNLHEDTHQIIEAIKRGEQIGPLMLENAKAKKELTECKGSLSALDKDFYSYIIKLRNAMTKYPERSINIYYQPDNKAEEYKLLREIFIILDKFDNPNTVTNQDVLNEWVAFKTRHGRAEENKYHILEYDITLLVRDFLNKFYSLQQ